MRPERAHRMALGETIHPAQIGTYALVVLDTPNAGYGGTLRIESGGVMCGSWCHRFADA